MAGQLFAEAKKDEGVRGGLATAEYGPLREWMTEHVHRHGRRYTREQLLERSTGQGLEPSFYIEYLSSKYSKIYGL